MYDLNAAQNRVILVQLRVQSILRLAKKERILLFNNNGTQ